MLDHILELPIHLPDSVCDALIKQFEASDKSKAVATVQGSDDITESAVVAEDVYMGEDPEWEKTNKEFHDIYVKQGLQQYLRYYNWINFDETKYWYSQAIMSKYPVNSGKFKPHQDWNSTGKGGNRSVTIITYLNNVEEGGETYFPNQNLMMHPRRGSMLIFPSGFTHAHEGRVPLSEDKYIIVSFANIDVGIEDEISKGSSHAK